MKLIKGFMFKFDGNMELTHAMWEAYMSVFRFRQQIFEKKLDYFERFKNITSVITQYDGSIGQHMGLVNHLGSKEYAQEKFLAVRLVHNSDEVRYVELEKYMHNNYVNCKDRCLKKLSDALNVLVNWKGEERNLSQQYYSSDGVDPITKENMGGFRGNCYNFWKSRRMARDCP